MSTPNSQFNPFSATQLSSVMQMSNEPYNEGWKHYLGGSRTNCSSCPYAEETHEHYQWWSGYFDCESHQKKQNLNK